jgi:uridine kinase
VDPAEAVRAACELIASRASTQNVAQIVAIDGAGGAGKSTLARGIAAALPRVSTILADDFYRPLHGDQRAAADPEYGYRNYFDWERIRDEALKPLRAGSPARFQRLDWVSARLADWITVEPADVVVLDGVYSSRPELRPYLDLAIFVETPRDLRRQRMLARGQSSTDWIMAWMAAEDWYIEHLKPAENADLIVAGS